MPAVLVTGPTVALAVFIPSGGHTIASTHLANPLRNGEGELAWADD